MADKKRYSFTKSERLLKATDFQAVFDHVDHKVSRAELLCLCRENSQNNPRLGLIIAKKNIRHAVQRNRVKRIIRESFRLHQHELPAVDLIIMARRNLGELENHQIHQSLENVWRKISQKAEKKKHST